MSYLTIRNLSGTTLELTLLERFWATPGPSGSSTTNRNRRRGYLRWGGGGSSSSDSSITGPKPFAREEISGVFIEPFETVETAIPAPNPRGGDYARLTIVAENAEEEGLRKVPSTNGSVKHDHGFVNGNGNANGHANGNGNAKENAKTNGSNGTHSTNGNATSKSKNTKSTGQKHTSKRTTGQHYTICVPSDRPHGLELQPTTASGATMSLSDAPALCAVYTMHKGHLAVLPRSDLQNWMAEVDGGWPLSSLSIPGTHNSPACYVALPSVRCQAVDIGVQLAHGIRFLDVRVNVHSNVTPYADPRMTLVHAVWAVSLRSTRWFSDLYATIKTFLQDHPTETVLLSLKREGTGRGTDGDLARQLLHSYVQPDGDSVWYTSPEIPTLDAVRGRIVLVRRFFLPGFDSDQDAGCRPDPVTGRNVDAEVFRSLHGFGLDASAWPDNCVADSCGSGVIRLQDFYEVSQAANMAQKLEYCRAQFARSAHQVYHKLAESATAARLSAVITDNSSTTTPATTTIGSTLHAAAAGMASAAIGAPTHASNPPTVPPTVPPIFLNFLSGSNFFNSSCWPEKIAAYVNPAVVEYLCIEHGVQKGTSDPSAGDASTGIVVTDWVGLGGDWDLIQTIIAWNVRLQLKR